MEILNRLLNSVRVLKFFGLFILLILLIPFPDPLDKIIMEPLANFCHLPIGFFACYILHRYLTICGIIIHPTFTAAFTLSLALTVEILQELVGRSASIQDLFITFWGVLAAIFLLEESSNRKMKYLLSFLSLMLGLLVSIPPIFYAYALYKEREELYPILLAVNTNLDRLIKTTGEAYIKNSNDSQCVFEIESKSSEWSGIELPIGDKDWSIFSELRLSTKNTGENDIKLLIRIDDSGNASEVDLRFGKLFELKPNEKTDISIPIFKISDSVKGKAFDIHSIRRLIISMEGDEKVREICIGKILLT